MAGAVAGSEGGEPSTGADGTNGPHGGGGGGEAAAARSWSHHPMHYKKSAKVLIIRKRLTYNMYHVTS